MKNTMVAIQNLILPNEENNRLSFDKRSTTGGSTFATHTEHTSAFNTVHIIAAVIGIVGAIAVAITIFIFCRRKRNKKNSKHGRDIENSNNMTETTTNNINCQHQRQTTATNHRFNQFASDFDNNVEAPKPAVTHIEDVSPLMQQYQLQLKLIQQEREKQYSNADLPCHHHPDRPSSSTASSPTSLMPPPPYQP